MIKEFTSTHTMDRYVSNSPHTCHLSKSSSASSLLVPLSVLPGLPLVMDNLSSAFLTTSAVNRQDDMMEYVSNPHMSAP